MIKLLTDLMPFLKSKKIDTLTFFDYSSKEKKKIMVKAAKEANKEQKKIVDQYKLSYLQS